MDYTTLSLANVKDGLDEIARDAQATFDALDATQLNWKPDTTSWSVAQCFEHLLSTNRQMLHAASEALNGQSPRTIWQRLPLLPGVFGRTLIRSQAPTATRKFKAVPQALPAASDITADVVGKFVAQQRELAAVVLALNERDASTTVMMSPFATFVAYSVLDGWRLVAAHNRRHFEQARRVTKVPGFPRQTS